MDSLTKLTRIGQYASAISAHNKFDFDLTNFVGLVFKNDRGEEVSIAITSLHVDDFTSDTWQAFYPFLLQVMNGYREALEAELDRQMDDVINGIEDAPQEETKAE